MKASKRMNTPKVLKRALGIVDRNEVIAEKSEE
jgi:hypothetical protein